VTKTADGSFFRYGATQGTWRPRSSSNRAGLNGAKACYCRSCAPLSNHPPQNHRWLAQGARFAPCALGGCATVSQVSQESGPGMQTRLGVEMAVQATQSDLTRARCYLLTNSAQFARLFLPASSRSVPHHAPESLLVVCWLLVVACWLLAGACWCLLIPARAS